MLTLERLTNQASSLIRFTESTEIVQKKMNQAMVSCVLQKATDNKLATNLRDQGK